MLRHNRTSPVPPARIVVLGGGGFVGGTIARRVARDRTPVLSLGREQVDLLSPDAAGGLAGLLRSDDALVIASAKAPCKTAALLVDNIKMLQTVCDALAKQSVCHVVYISSDAVYADSPVPLTEGTPTAPTSLHGVMHLARELILAPAVGKAPYAVLRLTLVYGAGDPHNGYGPNLFRRLVNKGEPIILFGLGEERRDHVHIDDVAEIARLVLYHQSSGVLNVATGEVASFRQVAEAVALAAARSVTIATTTRTGPMPHNGYRPFDTSSTLKAFPGFRHAPLAVGLARAQRDEFGR